MVGPAFEFRCGGRRPVIVVIVAEDTSDELSVIGRLEMEFIIPDPLSLCPPDGTDAHEMRHGELSVQPELARRQQDPDVPGQRGGECLLCLPNFTLNLYRFRRIDMITWIVHSR